MKPSITISEGAQNLFLELLSEYKGVGYDELPENFKKVINSYEYKLLVDDLYLNKEVKPRFNKLYVLVDYINAFVNGSLGSEEAKSIEENVYNQLNSAINDSNTAVIVLIDSHYNDESYLKTREGKHLPILHANTENERLLYGKVGELLGKYYDSTSGEYESNSEDGVWFIYKSEFGSPNMTDSINSSIGRSIDKLSDLLNDNDLMESSDKIMNNDFRWNHIYDTMVNLCMAEFIPNEITVAGVATNICVLSNVILLQNEFPQAEIYVNSDTVASYNIDLHYESLDVMKGLGINVIE